MVSGSLAGYILHADPATGLRHKSVTSSMIDVGTGKVRMMTGNKSDDWKVRAWGASTRSTVIFHQPFFHLDRRQSVSKVTLITKMTSSTDYGWSGYIALSPSSS